MQEIVKLNHIDIISIWAEAYFEILKILTHEFFVFRDISHLNSIDKVKESA